MEADLSPLVFPRADPEALDRFDQETKRCVMNCGPHAQDPRSWKEIMFLCNDCWPASPQLQAKAGT